jgi:hypothetical protein
VRRRSLLVAGAVACSLAAVFALLLAGDVLRWDRAIRADDVRYRASAGATDLWDPTAIVPLGVAEDLLRVDDDVAFRRAVRALRLANVENPSSSDPQQVLQRAEAENRLEAIANGDGDAGRRSRALTLLAALRLSTPSANREERAAALRSAVAGLQEAIALDPGNDDAKYNLEGAFRTSRGVQTAQGGPAPNPNSGPGGSRGAATGPPGSGY